MFFNVKSLLKTFAMRFAATAAAVIIASSSIITVSGSAEQFSDVSPSDWFYADVISLAEKNVISGYPDGTFQPSGSITVAEFTKLIVTALELSEDSVFPQPRIFPSSSAGFYAADALPSALAAGPDFTSDGDTDDTQNRDETVNTNEGFTQPPDIGQNARRGISAEPAPVKSETQPEPYWAQKYIDIAAAAGIIPLDDIKNGNFNPENPITRSYMAMMLVLGLDIEIAYIDNPFSDVNDRYVNTAYNRYLVRGYLNDDGTREFHPSDRASRAEAAAIIERASAYNNDRTAFREQAILENAAVNPLNSEFELIELFNVLNSRFMTTVKFKTSLTAETVLEYYRRAETLRPELYYGVGVSCRYVNGSGEMTVTVQYDREIEQIERMAVDAETKAKEVLSQIIREGMTDIEKIKAIHDFIILNCKYDYYNYLNNTIPFESFNAYGALINKTAVCQGYCSAFNLMCGIVGIRSISVAGNVSGNSELHSWNAVLLGGDIRFIDVTYDDPVPDRVGEISYTFFNLTDKDITALGYKWDKALTNMKYFY